MSWYLYWVFYFTCRVGLREEVRVHGLAFVRSVDFPHVLRLLCFLVLLFLALLALMPFFINESVQSHRGGFRDTCLFFCHPGGGSWSLVCRILNLLSKLFWIVTPRPRYHTYLFILGCAFVHLYILLPLCLLAPPSNIIRLFIRQSFASPLLHVVISF